MQLGRPLKVLGQAIFNIEGLVCSGSLDSFWTKPLGPDPDLRDDFVRLLAATTQVRGGYHSSAGSRAAVQAFAERVLSGRVNGACRQVGHSSATRISREEQPDLP